MCPQYIPCQWPSPSLLDNQNTSGSYKSEPACGRRSTARLPLSSPAAYKTNTQQDNKRTCTYREPRKEMYSTKYVSILARYKD